MSIVNPLNNAVIINQHENNFSYAQKKQGSLEKEHQATVIEADYVRGGGEKAHKQADELLERANSYVESSYKLPFTVKQSLQAYTSLDISQRQEALSNLMGVDFYA
ncbi:hypothetical protein [Glaciecola petra]|uniref:Uncharacterized protein n=1 Tax=Glaciecola petra TaxID=3075602 RepID=A0ABU2ZNU0_9ALTE|nr:hypothetical protein [Aestuariibacter sp. P117]MDT0593936.1 hypothetical protein [Aestuariibacter sp. P117]